MNSSAQSLGSGVGLILTSLVIAAAGFLGNDPLLGLALFSSLIPCLLFVRLARTKQVPSFLAIGPLVMVTYFLFFVVRGLDSIAADGSQLFLKAAEGSPRGGATVLLGIGVAMTFFVLAYGHGFRAPIDRFTQTTHPSTEIKAVLVIALGLAVLAILGFTLMFIEYGGFAGMTQQFATHTKFVTTTVEARFGQSLWSTFLAPAVWLMASYWALLSPPRSKSQGLLLAIPLALAVLASALIFGSRKDLLLIGLGVAVVVDRHVRPLSIRLLLLLSPIFILFSIWIVGYRTGNVYKGIDSNLISSNLGHGVYDVLLAVHERPFPTSYVADPERVGNALVGLVPRPLWPNKPNPSPGLDALLAQHYSNSLTTGYPSSIFAEWYVLGGWAAVFAATFIFGLLAGRADSWSWREPNTFSRTLVFVGVCTAFLIYFKDGDVISSTAGGIKRVSVVLLLAIAVRFISQSRQQVATHPEPEVVSR